MTLARRLSNQAAVRGFTLIELLLTLVLLMLLAGALVINFSALQSSAQLDEAAEQLESTIRYARAYATSSGCRVRLTFEEAVDEGGSVPMGNVFVEWEPDPLRKPGVYEPLRDVATLLESMLEAAQIDDVRALDAWGATPTAQPAEGDDAAVAGPTFAPITFFPDGSSDSAEIVLASRNEEETRRISVTIVGATGVIRKTTLTDAKSAEEQEWLETFGE